MASLSISRATSMTLGELAGLSLGITGIILAISLAVRYKRGRFLFVSAAVLALVSVILRIVQLTGKT